MQVSLGCEIPPSASVLAISVGITTAASWGPLLPVSYTSWWSSQCGVESMLLQETECHSLLLLWTRTELWLSHCLVPAMLPLHLGNCRTKYSTQGETLSSKSVGVSFPPDLLYGVWWAERGQLAKEAAEGTQGWIKSTRHWGLHCCSQLAAQLTEGNQYEEMWYFAR